MKLHPSYQAALQRILWFLGVLTAIVIVSWLAPPISQIKGISGYLPLHIFIETLSIVVAASVFGICWNANTQGRASNFLLLGCVFLGVAALDFMHILSYAGMPEFVTPGSPGKSIYFWLSARTLSVLGLMLVAVAPWRPIRSSQTRWLWSFIVAVLVTLTGWVGLWHLDWMPTTFVDGSGLTAFKIGYEYILIVLLLCTALRFLWLMRVPQSYDAPGLFAAVCVMALSEFYFTLYAEVTDIFNVLGHLYKVIAYSFIYRSIFIGSVQEPYKRLAESEKTLQESEQRFALAMRGANDGLWDWDLETGKIYYSPRWKEMLGYRENEIADHLDSWRRLVHPDDRDYVLQKVDDYTSGRADSFFVELRMQHKDGHWVNILSRAFLVRRENDGKPVRLIGTHVDITRHKQLEEDLRLSSQILQNSGEGLLVTDENNLIIAINPAFTKITGYSQSEALGKTPRILQSDRQKPDFYRQLWDELDRTGQWQGEIWDRRKNGEVYPKWLTINTIPNPDGSVHRYIALFSDITEKKQSEETIWLQANFDELTRLPNRRMFHDRLGHEIVKSNHSGKALALLLIDLDDFKKINDILGHGTGDMLLEEASRRIAGCARNTDTVARLGGDEFAVILSEFENLNHVEDTAQKIIDSLAVPFQLGDEKSYLSASIGISLFPTDAPDIDTLLRHADQAMYEAKKQGHGRFSYFKSSLQEAAHKRLRVSNELRLALEREEFCLYYQPQIDTASGKVVGAEVLIRWLHPQHGLCTPAYFIDIAEDTGLIVPIGEWVLRTACHQLKVWSELGITDMTVSVNLSAKQFHFVSLVDMVADVIAESGINPLNLELEITESLAMANSAESIRTLEALRMLGVSLAIDDFGTGYSSLAYLKDFPINRLKLDRSFIINVETEPKDAVIVMSTIVLAHDLGLSTIAEGVETEAQIKYLARLGCDNIQGYYFSKPLTASEAEAYIKRRMSVSPASGYQMPATNILVIDDDEWICQFMAGILESMGHHVTSATDPIIGLEHLRNSQESFDLVMVDMLLPNISGLDLVQAIRKENRIVPIMVVTSHKIDAIRKIFQPLEKPFNLVPGMNFFMLEKPLTESGIQQAVRGVLDVQAHLTRKVA